MADFRKARERRLTGLGSAILLIAASAVASAQAPKIADKDPFENLPGRMLYADPGVPDISGLWLGTFTAEPGGRPQQHYEERDLTRWAPWPPPLTPPYQKIADERIAAAKAGRALGDLGARCLPRGMPEELTLKVVATEIVQTPGAVSIFFWGRPLIVWTDGRLHPKDLKPTYNGHSIGRWVDDTLHVDTVGILAETPVDAGPSTVHSGKLHVKTTFQRVAEDTMHVHITLYDDEAFTEPMVTTNLWHRKSGWNWQMFDDASCFENNKNLPDATGATGFPKF